jgi:hypothetical protein
MEALAKKGIFFANRKVVVELPPGLEKEIGSSPSGTPAKPSAGPAVPSAADVLKAGAAAAAVQLMEEEEQQKTLEEKTKEDTRS